MWHKKNYRVIAGLTRNRLKITCERLRVKPAMTPTFDFFVND
jgi:hypothetical protein